MKRASHHDRSPFGRLSRNPFVKNVSYVLAGSMIGQLLLVATAPVLTRLYMPDDFGLFAAFTAIASLVLVVSSLRYELAIPLPSSDAVALALIRMSLLINLVISVITLTVVWRWREIVASSIGTPDLAPLLWLLPVVVLATGSYQALSYWPVRAKDFRFVSRTSVEQAALQLTSQTGLGLLGTAPAGLVVGVAVSRIGGAVRIARRISALAPHWWRTSDGVPLRDAAAEYRRFPLLSTWVGLLVTGALQAPALLLASLYGVGLAGLFAVTVRLVGAPMALLGNAVSQVFLGEAADLAREDPRALRRLFVKVTRTTLFAAAVPFAVVALVAPWMSAALLGDEWREVGQLIRLAAPMFLLQIVVSPPSHVLTVLGHQGRQVLFAGSRLLGIVATFLGANALGYGGRTAIGAYSVVMSVSYVWFWVLCLRTLNRQVHDVEAQQSGASGPSDALAVGDARARGALS